MADSLSISPVALFAPAGISPIASTLPVTARFAVDSSLFADERSVVDLSTEGQLLSALSTFRASLLPQPEATPAATGNDQAAATTIAATDPTTATPTSATPSTAQNLVNAFNTLLDSISTLPSGTTPPTTDDIAEQLTATLSALATTSIATDDGATLTLPAIGIAPSATGPALQLDQAQLATALASAPATTQAVLDNTTETFATFAATAESELANAATPPLPLGDLNLLGTATPLPADTNDLPNLTQPQVTPGLAPATIDTLAAEQRSTAANLTLQNLLTDPRLRAINNQFDPAYAAVIAASHLSDFDSPRPFIDPTALATDTVGPVSALVRAQAIADYREAAGEAERRTLIGTSTTHQYWI